MLLISCVVRLIDVCQCMDLQVTTTLIIFNTTFLTLSTTLQTNLYPLTGPSPLQGPWMLWRHMQPRLRPPCSTTITTTTTTTSGQSSIPATHPTAPPAIFLRPPSKWNLVSFNLFLILIGHFIILIENLLCAWSNKRN